MLEMRAGFHVNKKDWEDFKVNCKKQGSNASTELRRFVKMYNEFHDEFKSDVKGDFFAKIQLEK